MTNEQKSYLALTLVNISFGFVGLLVRESVDTGSDIYLTAFSTWIFASLLIFTFASINKNPVTFSFPKKIKISLLLQGLFFGLTNVFFFSALTKTTIANAEFIHKTMPIWVAIFAFFILKEKFTNRKLIATGLVVAGMSLLFNFDFSSSTFIGDFHAFIASLFFAGMVVNARRLKNVPHLITTFFQVFVGALIVLPVVLWNYPYTIIDFQQLIFVLLILSIVLTAITQVFVMYAFRYLEASKGSLFMILQPVSATIVSWIFLSERLTAQAIFGIFLIVSGVIAVVLANNRKPAKAG